MTEEQTCGGCRFFTRLMPLNPLGRCRRYPPTLVFMGYAPPSVQGGKPLPTTDTFWPLTTDTEFCGEWIYQEYHAVPESVDLAHKDAEGTA